MFTPELDKQILDGFLEDREATLREMAKAGFSRQVVLDRAGKLGLSTDFIKKHRGKGLSVTLRRCLSCDTTFVSAGKQNRLCSRCRKRQ